MRRRRKNPLIARIFGAAIALHILFLPILAKYGVFKNVQRSFGYASVELAPHPAPVTKRQAPPHLRTTQHTAAPRRQSAAQSQGRVAPQRSNLNTPRVIAAGGGPAGGGGGGPTVVQGTGKSGVLPTPLAGPPPVKPAPPIKPAPEPPVPEPTPVVKPIVPVRPTPTKPEPPMPKPEPPRNPVFTTAEPLPNAQPRPTIPEDLLTSDLNTRCVAEIDVDRQGVPTEVSIVKSTGLAQLDERAAAAARQWRFRPATQDGEPVPGHVRLTIEFEVN